MRIFDFLIYYLTTYFERNRNLLSWSSPLERTCYATGLAATGFLYSVQQVLQLTVFHKAPVHFARIIFLLIALGLMKLFGYLYIDRNRYDFISSNDLKRPKVKYSTGVSISIVIVFLCIFSPLWSYMLLVPFGSGKH
jgi:hypothetical protein